MGLWGHLIALVMRSFVLDFVFTFGWFWIGDRCVSDAVKAAGLVRLLC